MTQTPEELAKEHWKSKCNGAYFIARAASDNMTREVSLDFYAAGYRAAMKEVLKKLIDGIEDPNDQIQLTWVTVGEIKAICDGRE